MRRKRSSSPPAAASAPARTSPSPATAHYGYDEIAEELREKTLSTVYKWYKKTGTIFEFYDPLDKTIPYRCERKGKQPRVPDWRKQWHSIVDFNWSSCFTLLFIQREFY